MIIPIPGLGKIGIVVDLPFNELPMNAWTDGRNIKFRDEGVEKFSGHVAQLGDPGISPQWLLHTSQGGTAFWLYASASKVYATDGAIHAEITRASGPYVMNPQTGWTGTIIEDIPVINDGSGTPQMWNKPALATKLVDIPGWTPNMTTAMLTGLKRYLVAIDITKTGVRSPTMVKWSHQAPSGNVPQTWNEADETIDAGEYNLPGDGGYLVDAHPLRDDLVLYKESQTWKMQYVGGIDVFRFTKLFNQLGALSRRCAIEFFSGKQLVYTGDDVVLHDGQQAQSVVSARNRKLISGAVDTTNFNKAFVCSDPSVNEVWVCIPEPGQSFCTKALVWNWLSNQWGVRELPGAGFATSGIVNPISLSTSWAGATGTWADAKTAWGDRVADPTKRKLLMAIPGDAGNSATWKLYTPGISQQFAGTNMVAYAERQGIGFPTGKDRSGQFPPDYTRVKQVMAIWPRITGTLGGTISVFLGTQQRINGPVIYEAPRSFRIGIDDMIDCSGSEASKIHALKFQSDSDIEWKLAGYDVDIIDRGR